MKRTWQYISLVAAGTPQPVFGTTLTNAVVANPGLLGNTIDLVVGTSVGIVNGDNIILDPLNNPERLLVQRVVNGTTLRCRNETGLGIQFAHNAGVYVQLAIPCISIFIQMKAADTSAIVIGNSGLMNKATGQYCILTLQPTGAGVQPYNFADPTYGGLNGMVSNDYWFDGTTNGDSILPSLTVL